MGRNAARSAMERSRCRAIVHGGAEHELGMHGDAHVAETLDVLDDVTGAWTIHQRAAQPGSVA